MSLTLNVKAAGFDLANARALAEHAKLVYSPENEIKLALADVGFTTIQPIYDPVWDTFGYLASHADYAVLCWRGTRPISLRNWVTDLRAKFVTVGPGLRVHEGSHAVFERVKGYVQTLTVPLFITGHSLGGMLAIYSADALKQAPAALHSVYTFGQPRVGNRAWCDAYDAALKEQTFRVVDEADVVPWLPGLLYGYRHAAHEVYISAWGGYVADPQWWETLPVCAYAIWSEWRVKRQLAPLDDHYMDNYQARLNR